jgi:hypothetical protein
MPKRKKSDDTVEKISNTSESIVAVSALSFSSAKEEIASTWPSCWTFEEKIFGYVQKSEKLVVVPVIKFKLLELRQKRI